jgi:uncharacterized protein YcfJ
LQLIKFIFGILIAQVATYIMVLLLPEEPSTQSIIQTTIPLLFIAVVIAFWFNTLSAYEKKDALYKKEGDFAKERERLKVKAEKEKIKTMKEAQKEIVHEATKTHAKANFKVGLSVAGVAVVGGLFVFAQMITAGLLVLTTTGGVLGGYYWRGKRFKNQQLTNASSVDGTLPYTDIKVIERKKD